MKEIIYWYFIHKRYDSILKRCIPAIHIESYLSSNGTSKTYIY